MSAPKPITEHLADLLRERSARGLEKYGTSIDRGDLNRAEWLQHLLEELLDAAQYVEAAKRQAPCAELPEPMPPTTLDMPLTREQREAEDSFRDGWNSCRATVMLAATQQDERIGAWHLVFDTMLRVRPKVFHNDKTAQQAVCDEIEAMAAALAATPQPLAEPVAFFPNRLPDVDASDAPAHWYHKGWNDCRTQALHARAPQAEPVALIQWAEKSEPENHPWAAGYEAAREYVRMQLRAAPQPQAEPVASGSAVLDGLLRSGLALSAKEAATNDKLPKWARDRFAMCARALEKDAAPQPQAENAAADAYHHACELLAAWQAKRVAAGLDPGCEGSLCDGLSRLFAMIDAAPQPQAEPRTPIENLMAQYTSDGCDFTDMVFVRTASLRYVKTMPDSQARCLLYAWAAAPQPQARAEDVALVDELVRQSGLAGPTIKAAWQRIEADMIRLLGVGK
jgi:hypothetical protein